MSGLCAILRRDLPKFIVKLWVDVILFLFQSICHVRIELRGYDNIPKKNSAIIASKHQSALETLVYYQHWSLRHRAWMPTNCLEHRPYQEKARNQR